MSEYNNQTDYGYQQNPDIMDWDDEVSIDQPDIVTLPAGDYEFEVLKVEKERYNGGEKVPPCNRAAVQMKIEGPEGVSIFRESFLLYRPQEGFIANFFRALGLRKKGEPLRMNWQAVVGRKGKAKIKIRPWKSQATGNEGISNEVQRYYYPDENPEMFAPQYTAPQQAPQQTQQQQTMPQGGGWNKGTF